MGRRFIVMLIRSLALAALLLHPVAGSIGALLPSAEPDRAPAVCGVGERPVECCCCPSDGAMYEGCGCVVEAPAEPETPGPLPAPQRGGNTVDLAPPAASMAVPEESDLGAGEGIRAPRAIGHARSGNAARAVLCVWRT